jgi:hypothetical protein
MSTFSADLFSFVTGDAPTAALIGTRLFPNLLPESTLNNWPGCSVVYKTLTNERHQSQDGDSKLSATGIQFDAYSRARPDAKAVMDTLAALFMNFKGSIGPGLTPVGAIIFQHEADGYESETRLFRATVEYTFWNQT